jgi:hypothetical protein
MTEGIVKTTSLVVIFALIIAGVAYAEEDKEFSDLKECYRFIAADEELPTDDVTVFKLAAESTLDYIAVSDKPYVLFLVVKPNFHLTATPPLYGYSSIRGAQDNGRYYAFVTVTKGFRLIGRMVGRSYKLSSSDGHLRFILDWHWSAFENYENIYDWDGVELKQISHILYRYEPDGARREIKNN